MPVIKTQERICRLPLKNLQKLERVIFRHSCKVTTHTVTGVQRMAFSTHFIFNLQPKQVEMVELTFTNLNCQESSMDITTDQPFKYSI